MYYSVDIPPSIPPPYTHTLTMNPTYKFCNYNYMISIRFCIYMEKNNVYNHTFFFTVTQPPFTFPKRIS